MAASLGAASLAERSLAVGSMAIIHRGPAIAATLDRDRFVPDFTRTMLEASPGPDKARAA